MARKYLALLGAAGKRDGDGARYTIRDEWTARIEEIARRRTAGR